MLFARCPVVATTRADEAEHAVTEVFLPHRLTVLDRDRSLDMRFNATRVAGITAAYLTYGRDIRLTTVDTINVHIDVPVTGAMLFRSGTRDAAEATPSVAAVFTPGMPADLLWPADCALLCLMIDRAEVERELAAMLGCTPVKPLLFGLSMDLTTPAGRSWMSAVTLLAQQADNPGSPLHHPIAARNVQNLLIDTLLLTHPHNYQEALTAPPPAPGARPIQEALGLLESRPDHPWSTSELANEVAVSVRSLQEGFLRTVGLSPMAYLREVRLRRAHGDLKAARPETTTVTAVAGRWGFLHPGRFASVYRSRFGEPPSATLRGHP